MSENRQKSWLKITCLGCAILPCLMGFLTYGYVKYRVSKSAEELPVEVAKLKKLGIPTEATDLNPNPPVPDSENAAPIYREIIKKMEAMKALKEDPAIAQALGSNLTYEVFLDDHALAAKGLANRAEILKLAEEAAAKPKCDFKRDYSQGANLLMPEFSPIKTVVKWLALRAKYQAQAGDFDGALRSIRTCFTIGGHIATEPTLIAALVAFAIDAISVAALEQVTILGENNPAFLAKSRKLLETLPPLPDFRHAFGGEVILGRYGIQNLKSLRDLQGYTGDDWDGEPPPPSPLDKATVGDSSVRKMFEAKFLARWRWVFEHMPADPDDWKGLQATMKQLEVDLEKATGLEDRVNQILFPVFTEASRAKGVAMARRRVALLATRILQDRPQGLPANIAPYGKIAIDPMNDKPMGYERKGKGFKVWSVDRDLHDNSGLKRIPGVMSSAPEYDFVWGFDFNFPQPPKPKEKRASRTSTGPRID